MLWHSTLTHSERRHPSITVIVYFGQITPSSIIFIADFEQVFFFFFARLDYFISESFLD